MRHRNFAPWRAALLRSGLPLLAFPGLALACPCSKEPDPTAQREQAQIILDGEVSMIEALPNKLENLTRATIRVMKVKLSNGHLAGFVRVDTPASAEGCGYPFRAGEKREFLITRVGSRFFTNACLMVGAQGDPAIPPERADTTTR